MGYINSINVSVGDKVNKGDLLAVIESSDIQARQAQAQAMVSEAEAALSNAQKDYDRFTQLHNMNSASDKELENIRLQYISAKARTETARQMRNEAVAMKAYTNISAPFTGYITQKYSDAGAIASPGMPLLSLESDKEFQITASVPEMEITSVMKNQYAYVTIPSINKSFKASISEISNSSLQSGGQYLIRIIIPDTLKNDLLSGQYANITLTDKQESKQTNVSIRVPVSSIVYKDQLTGLYTISSFNTALLRWVRLGKQFGDHIEILSGLNADEKFILSSNNKLWNGAPVVIQSKNQ